MHLRTTDPAVRRDRAVQLAVAAGSTALALIRPAALGPGGRVAYRLALAGLAATSAWSSGSREPWTAPGSRAGITIGTTGATLGLTGPAEHLDEALHLRLLRAGVGRPRLVHAAITAAAFGALLASDLRSPSPAGIEEEPLEDRAPQPIPVPDDVRALAAALLAGADGHGADALREQLRLAEALPYEGAGEGGFWPGIGFAVPEGLPLAVPGNGVFPVVGRFRALGDRTFDAYLVVERGLLAGLHVGTGADWTVPEIEAWMEEERNVDELAGWPDLAELVLLVETAEGLRPA